MCKSFKFQHFAFKSRLGLIRIFCFLNHKSVLEGSKAIGPININMYEMLKEEKRGRFQNLKFGSCFCFLQSTSKAQLIRSFFLFVSSPFTFLLRFCLLADLSRKRRWRHRRTSGRPTQPGDRPVRPDDHLPLAHVRGQRHQPAQDPQSRDRTVPVRRSCRAGQDPVRGGWLLSLALGINWLWWLMSPYKAVAELSKVLLEREKIN